MPEKHSGPQSVSVELELLRTPRAEERADAARNRIAILAAAAKLFAARGVEAVSMDAVATEAGVGKGTLFRRFGDKAGLAVALLDNRESRLQQEILSGPPPLGPGAEAAERLVAFVNAYLDYLLAHLDLVRMSETASPGARYRIGAYRFWHRHLAILFGRAEDVDAEYAAHSLLAVLGAEHVMSVLPQIGEERMREGTVAVALALLGTTAAG